MTDAGQGAAEGTEQVTVTIPAALYARLRNVAHDEGRAIEDQIVQAVEEMLNERRRRPLFD